MVYLSGRSINAIGVESLEIDLRFFSFFFENLKQNKRDIKAKKTLQKINKLSYQQKMKKLKGQAVIYKGSKSNEAIQQFLKLQKHLYEHHLVLHCGIYMHFA